MTLLLERREQMLFIPDRELMTDPSKYTTKVQLGNPKSFIWHTCKSMSEGLTQWSWRPRTGRAAVFRAGDRSLWKHGHKVIWYHDLAGMTQWQLHHQKLPRHSDLAAWLAGNSAERRMYSTQLDWFVPLPSTLADFCLFSNPYYFYILGKWES